MWKHAIIYFLALASPLLGEDYRFSGGCFDDRRGVVAFNQRLDGKLYLVLTDLKHNSSQKIEISGKSSSPTVCGGAVAICSYGDGKILFYDYELRPVSEVAPGKGLSPFYSFCGSDGRFLYVYIVQCDNEGSRLGEFIYRYSRNEGKLTLDGSSPVEIVGEIVTYQDSVFVVNEKSCQKVTFTK